MASLLKSPWLVHSFLSAHWKSVFLVTCMHDGEAEPCPLHASLGHYSHIGRLALLLRSRCGLRLVLHNRLGLCIWGWLRLWHPPPPNIRGFFLECRSLNCSENASGFCKHGCLAPHMILTYSQACPVSLDNKSLTLSLSQGFDSASHSKYARLCRYKQLGEYSTPSHGWGKCISMVWYMYETPLS